MLTIRKATTDDVAIIQLLAHAIWPVTYSAIISEAQLQYMLQLFYSSETLSKLIEEDTQHFIISFENNTPIGFASFSCEEKEIPSIYKLHKIYVLPHKQGKGAGKALLDYVINELKNLNVSSLILNVNRHNSAIEFYKKAGFTIVKEVDNKIGNGYFMNDYVMGINFV